MSSHQTINNRPSGINLKTGLRGGGSYGGAKDPPSGLNHNQRGLGVATKG
ncbi:MAG: hypothetical protein HY823_01940 [Acidobacteria bacterium]|nr:hypothetical protein [Acidobacteriota bacterium]